MPPVIDDRLKPFAPLAVQLRLQTHLQTALPQLCGNDSGQLIRAADPLLRVCRHPIDRSEPIVITDPPLL